MLFMDIDTIQAGADFHVAIDDALSEVRIALILIGRSWLTLAGPGGPRLFEPADLVRHEVAAALGKGLKVIPVLVDGAPMPCAADLPEDLAALASRNAFEISDTRWDYDVDRLIDAIATMSSAAASNSL